MTDAQLVLAILHGCFFLALILTFATQPRERPDDHTEVPR